MRLSVFTNSLQSIAMQNHFQFFNLPIRFEIDEADLKQRYLANSRQFHPDFFAGQSAKAQAEALQKTTQNNEAYQILRDEDRRIQYILQIKGMLTEGERNALPPSFLSDMMDLNEQVMEWQATAMWLCASK